MNSSEIHKHLAEYADGELDPAHRAEIEAHLAQDADSRAEVARWQALRQSTHRALVSEPVPRGLEDRIRANLRASRRVRGRRLYYFGLPGLGVAAAVVLALFLWPRGGAAATNVPVSGFASVYRHCALEHRHDTLNVRGDAGCKTLSELQADTPLAAGLPDLPSHGYRLDGACWCGPPECKQCGARVLHAYFRRSDDPNDVVSAFVISCPIKLCSCNGKPCPGCRRGAAEFRDGTDGDVSLVCWTCQSVSYVLAGRMPQEKLARLADGALATSRPKKASGTLFGLPPQVASRP